MLFALATVALIGLRAALPMDRPDDRVTPRTALAHVPPELAAKPVFNHYNFGGYLISQGVKVFIDGRADMYGEAFLDRYLEARNGGAAFDAVVVQHRIAWAITKPDDSLARALDGKPGWRRIWRDQTAAVYAREAAL
jgi:hypothetical protein